MPLASLTQLTSLHLSGCEQVSDLSPLASLTQLTSLYLSGVEQVSDWNGLANLKSLKVLRVDHEETLTIPEDMRKQVTIYEGSPVLLPTWIITLRSREISIIKGESTIIGGIIRWILI